MSRGRQAEREYCGACDSPRAHELSLHCCGHAEKCAGCVPASDCRGRERTPERLWRSDCNLVRQTAAPIDKVAKTLRESGARLALMSCKGCTMSYAGDTMTTTLTAVPALARRQRQILLVEDEGAIRELLRLHLSLAGFEVEEMADGASALDRARSERFDLIVLDLMLPRLDGLTVCRALRAQGANAATPILMLTARDTEADKVLGLESGADDYLTKPFGIRELLARIGAILRRCDRSESLSPAPARRVQSRDVMLDAERRAAVVRG